MIEILFIFDLVTAEIKQEFGSVFEERQLNEFLGQFRKFDLDASGGIDIDELRQVLNDLGESTSEGTLTDMINEVSADKSGVITFHDFLVVMKKIKLGQSTAFGDVYKVVKERLSHFEGKIKQAKIDAKKNDPTKIKFNSKISKFENFQGGESSSTGKPGPKPSGKLNTTVR
jgi:hypothetical protein